MPVKYLIIAAVLASLLGTSYMRGRHDANTSWEAKTADALVAERERIVMNAKADSIASQAAAVKEKAKDAQLRSLKERNAALIASQAKFQECRGGEELVNQINESSK